MSEGEPGGVGSYVMPRYATYQDVRRNISVATVVFLVLVAEVFGHFVLLPEHQSIVGLGKASGEGGAFDWAKEVVALAVAAIPLAILLVHYMEFHQRLIDTYLVGWRDRFEARQIVPLLIERSRATDDEKGELWARIRHKHPERYMRRLYYAPYADAKRQDSALVERLYEALTAYWITQVLEPLLIVLLLATGVYFWFVPANCELPWGCPRLPVTLVIAALVLVNHYFSHVTRGRAERRIRQQAWQFIETSPEELTTAVRSLVARTEDQTDPNQPLRHLNELADRVESTRPPAGKKQ
jgi:hypothetical protein